MKVQHWNRCGACNSEFVALVAWDERTVTCVCGGTAERIYRAAAAMHDDTLPGGPRYLHNLGDEPVWVETKTQFANELRERGLEQRERGTYNKNDKSPWATQNRLRPGCRDDTGFVPA